MFQVGERVRVLNFMHEPLKSVTGTIVLTTPGGWIYVKIETTGEPTVKLGEEWVAHPKELRPIKPSETWRGEETDNEDSNQVDQ